MKKGKIFLIPVTLGDDNYQNVIPHEVIERVKNLRYFVVEEIRTARRFLRLIDKSFPIDESTFFVLNEHNTEKDITGYLQPAIEGNDMGVMSEAGLPCIADPGTLLVKEAHVNEISVSPLTGPSSIILALISSGFNGQNFAFNGYLPVKPEERDNKIKELERLATRGVTQIFMETPYRNQKTLEAVLQTCNNNTKLCIASDITLPIEQIITKPISAWKKSTPEIKNHFVIFVMGI